MPKKFELRKKEYTNPNEVLFIMSNGCGFIYMGTRNDKNCIHSRLSYDLDTLLKHAYEIAKDSLEDYEILVFDPIKEPVLLIVDEILDNMVSCNDNESDAIHTTLFNYMKTFAINNYTITKKDDKRFLKW